MIAMKWIMLVGASVLAIAIVITRRRHEYGTDTNVSQKWLRQQEQRDTRVEFHGPSLHTPINKLVNEQAWYQTRRLRHK